MTIMIITLISIGLSLLLFIPLGWYVNKILSIRRDIEKIDNFLELHKETITISREDYLRFIKMLENPPEPNEKLKTLMKKEKLNEQ